jgi:hypothetical protein
MRTFLIFLTASMATVFAGIFSVGIAWLARPEAQTSASPPQDTPRTFEQSMPAHAANAEADLGP